MLNERFKDAAGEWLAPDGPDADVVISTRARFARNVRGYRMPWRMRPAEKKTLETMLRDAITRADVVERVHYYNLSALDETSRKMLVERHLISRELAQSSGDRGVLFTPTESESIMINEEDHLRIQVIRAGFRVREAFAVVDRIDDLLAKKIDYAYSAELGFLTACPTNLGTGLRVSVMTHLPALVESKQISRVHRAASQVGLVIRGLYGEGTKHYGDFYQISNQMTLGRDEGAIVQSVLDVVTKIIEWERRVRDHLLKADRAGLSGKVNAAYDGLSNAPHISFEVAMKHLSALRMGHALGLLENLSLQAIHELVLYSQPAHLEAFRGASPEAAESDRVRADFIRERLKSDNN